MLPVLLLIFIAPAMAVAQTTPSDTIKGQIEVYLGPDGAASNEALLQLYTERADSIQVILDEVKNANDPARRASLLALHARIKDMEQDASLNALNASGGLRSSHFWMALIMSLALFAVIIDLVRRKLLRIEYSWLWVLTGVAIVALVLTGALNLISTIIGARVPQTLFFSGVVFLTLINLHYSVAISRLSNQAKNLSQELAILKHETESATPAPQDRGSTQ
jgi:hypothetical protein